MADREEKTFADLGRVRHTWSALAAHDYQAFTPALLYWNTNLDRDLVRDFASRQDRSTRIMGCDAPAPIFDIQDPVRELVIQCGGAVGEKREKLDLSRRLYFCPRSLWQDLRTYLSSYSTIDTQTGRFTLAVECPRIPVPDYVRLAEGFVPPGTIQVSSVGIYASDYCSLWRWNPSNIFEKPRAVLASPCDVVYRDGVMFMEQNL